MSGLDRGEATTGPANDGRVGVARQDSPWTGPEAASAAREAEPAATGEEPPATEPAVPAKPEPRADNPWHHSRPKRAARRPARPAVTPGSGIAALGRLGQLGRTVLPQVSPPPPGVWLRWLGGALVLAWLGTTTLHPVGPHDQAIVATFGASGPTLGPGLALSWPWPIGAAHVTDVTSVRHLAMPDGDGEHLMLTRDGSVIDVAYDVRWRIGDLRRHDLDLADPDATLRLGAETAMRAAVAGVDFATVMGGGHDALGHEAARRLQALLDRDRAGIAIDGIDIRRADPPARVADALRAVTSARNDAANEATEAHSWSQQLIVHAEGEAGAFDRLYAQYRQAPDVTRREMYYATMERVLGQSDKVIVDAPGTVTTLPPLSAPPGEAASGAARAGNGR